MAVALSCCEAIEGSERILDSKISQISGRLKDNGFQVVAREYIRQMFFPSEVILAVKEGDI